MENNTLPLTKEQLGQIIKQQLYTINCLVNERVWLTEQLSMYHDTTFQWQQYAQSLEMDLQRTKKEQVKIEESHSRLHLKYDELKWMYWQVKRKYEKCKTEFKYGMEVGKSICGEFLYYKQSYTELLEHYRQLWSACYATAANIGKEQERSDHGTAQQSTAVLPLNLMSRKTRSAPSEGEVPPLAFTYIMSFKADNVTSTGLRSKPGQAAGSVIIHPFPNKSVLDSLGLKRKAVGALRSPPKAAPIVDVKREKSSPLLPYATSSARLSRDKLEELELPQFQDKSNSIFPEAPSSVGHAKDELEVVEPPQLPDQRCSTFPEAPSSVGLSKDELEVIEALELPDKSVGVTKAKLELAEPPRLKIEYWSSFRFEEDEDECSTRDTVSELRSENAKAAECVHGSEVTKGVQGTREVFVSDELDRNKGEREAEPASACYNTAIDDEELDRSSQFHGDDPPTYVGYELNCADLSAKPKKSRMRRILSWVRKRLPCISRKEANN